MATRVAPAPRRFSIEEFDRMVETGILSSDDRVELIEGEIIEMSPIGDRHAAFVTNLTRLFVLGLRDGGVVWVQCPVRLRPRSKPQPDLAILRPRSYADAGPSAEDVRLVVEIVDTSLEYDQTVKLRLYALAGIPEYWIVDAGSAWIDVHRAPASGAYRETRRLTRGQTLAPLAFPDLAIAVDDIFA